MNISYEELKQATSLLKIITQGECDIFAGKFLAQEDFFSNFAHEFELSDHG